MALGPFQRNLLHFAFSYRGIISLIALMLAIPVARAEGLLGGTRREWREAAGLGTRLTRLGWGCIGLALLTFMLAGSTGNNLLYLLYSVCLSALLLSAGAGWWNLRRLAVEVEPPDQMFRGAQFPLRLRIKSAGRWSALGVDVLLGTARASVPVLRSGQTANAELNACAEHRGWNELSGLVLESRFPWGLIVHRRKLPPAKALALPRLREVHGAAEVRAEARSSGRPDLRKGSGDELYGVRPYDPGDDVRKINWKLSARTGRPLVNEFCENHDSKIVIRVPALFGEDAERRIEEAASACRYYIDSGVEVKLVTPESEVDFGKGLLHLDRLLVSLALLGDGRRPRPSPAGESPGVPPISDTAALRRLTLLGAYLVYAAVFLIDDVNPRLWALMAPLLPVGWLVQEKRRSLVPDVLWSLLSLIVLGYVILVEWRAADFAMGSTHVVMYLVAYCWLCPYRPENMRQTLLIYSLAFLLVSGLTISPWYVPFFVVYLGFCGAWLWLASGARWEHRGQWAPAMAGWAAACLAVAVFCFVATPRLEGLRRINPILDSFVKLRAKSSATTGFTENVSLGWFGELKRSSARVMKVKPLLPVDGRPGPLLIRGPAYDDFDGFNWSKSAVEFGYQRGDDSATSTGGRGWALRRPGELRFPAPAPTGVPPSFEFSIYPMALSVLFTVGTPWYVGGIDDASHFDHTDSIYVAAPYIGGLHYRIYPSMGPQGLHVGLARFDERQRARALALPPDASGRLSALARTAAGAAPDSASKAKAIEQYLRSRYVYSTFSDSRGRSLDSFLFDSKKGNCEYFASAGVVLMREEGIPARLVTGFVAEDWNEYGQFYDVRQRSAHAWVEAFLPGRGWTTFDPTPAQGSFSWSTDALSRSVERLIDAFQGEWYRSVIGYDQSSQRGAFTRLGAVLSFDRILVWMRSAFMLLAAGWGLWGIWTAVADARRRRARAARLGLYGRAESLLARAGLPRPADMTPREFAAAMRQRRPELPEIKSLAELHYRERYAGRPPTPAEAAEGSKLLRELGARL